MLQENATHFHALGVDVSPISCEMNAADLEVANHDTVFGVDETDERLVTSIVRKHIALQNLQLYKTICCLSLWNVITLACSISKTKTQLLQRKISR